MRAFVLFLAAVALAACGEDDERPATPAETRLVVEVRPKGEDGPVRRRTVDAVPAGITAADFAPTPPDVACTEIYGGPATARVTGTLEGERVDARLSRTNGCEIARWDRLEALLGRVPGPTLP